MVGSKVNRKPKRERAPFRWSQVREGAMRLLFLLSACVSIFAVICICFFLFQNGIPTIFKIGAGNFLFGMTWKPSQNLYGIFPMILASVYVTAGAILCGAPVGILCAVFLAKFCPKRLYRAAKSFIQLLAGIPSIVYGFFGLVVLVPMMQNLAGGSGKNMLTASILLGIMILPTIISVSESAISAAPSSYYEGSLALGATHERSVFFATVPSCKSAITAGVILGIGRAIGETMAVVMIAGNQPVVPSSLTDGVRTLTANVVLEMAYATDLHRDALIATAVVLFVFVLAINVLFSILRRR